MNEVPELRDEARDLILQGAALHMEAYHGGPQVITGFVLVVESMASDGDHNLSWTTGNGMPTTDGGGGLARWRLTGMLQDVLYQMQAIVNLWYMKDSDD